MIFALRSLHFRGRLSGDVGCPRLKHSILKCCTLTSLTVFNSWHASEQKFPFWSVLFGGWSLEKEFYFSRINYGRLKMIGSQNTSPKAPKGNINSGKILKLLLRDSPQCSSTIYHFGSPVRFQRFMLFNVSLPSLSVFWGFLWSRDNFVQHKILNIYQLSVPHRLI